MIMYHSFHALLQEQHSSLARVLHCPLYRNKKGIEQQNQVALSIASLHNWHKPFASFLYSDII